MADQFKACSVDGCNGNAHYSKQGRKGFCSAHYKRSWRHGNPLKGDTSKGEVKRYIQDVVLFYQEDECLIWPFAKVDGSRGVINIDGKNTLASRYICMLTHGNPPTPKHEAAHTCGKGHEGCCSPRHLVWKTKIENEADKITHGTLRRGELVNFSKLTEEQAREILSLKGKETQAAIAKRYGVGRVAVSNIHSRKTWAWLT